MFSIIKPKSVSVLAILLVAFLLVGCSSPEVSKCYSLCLKEAGVQSQWAKDTCSQSCSQMEYVGGTEAVQTFNEKTELKQSIEERIEAGEFDKVIAQCTVKARELWDLRMQFEMYAVETEEDAFRRMSGGRSYDDVTGRYAVPGCRSILSEGVVNGEFSAEKFLSQFDKEFEKIRDKIAYVESCFPEVYELMTQRRIASGGEANPEEMRIKSYQACKSYEFDRENGEKQKAMMRADIEAWS